MKRLFGKSKISKEPPLPVPKNESDPVTVIPILNTLGDTNRYSLLTDQNKERKLSEFN